MIELGEHIDEPLQFVAWGGKTGTIRADMSLGIAGRRKFKPYTLRAFVWHAAFGYVSGFPLSAIAYYLMTQQISEPVTRHFWKRTHPGRDYADAYVVHPEPYVEDLR